VSSSVVSYVCPARECGKPATLSGDRVVCEARHVWLATTAELTCPKCKAKARHVQARVDIVACGVCSASWKLDQIGARDSIKAGLVAGSDACNQVMLSVDEAVAGVLDAGAAAAIESGDTSLREVIARFKRGLMKRGGIPKK